MIEQLSVVQQAIESLGLAESASVISDGLKMAEGAIVGQLIVMSLKFVRSLLTPTELEPVEKVIIETLSSGSWVEANGSLMKDRVSAKLDSNGSLTVSVDNNSKATDLLSHSAKAKIRKLLSLKQEEFKKAKAELEAEEEKAEKKTIYEKLIKKI